MPFLPLPPPTDYGKLADFLLCAVKVEENTPQAVEICERSFRENKDPYSLEFLIRSAFSSKRFSLLEKLAEFLKEKKKYLRWYYEIEALLALKNNDIDAFYNYALKAVREGSENVTILLNLYKTALKRKDFRTLREVLLRIHELHPKNKKVVELLLILLPEKEKIEFLKRLVEKNPSVDYYLKLIELLLRENKDGEAERYLKKAVEIFPNDERLKQLELFFLVSEGKLEEAKEFAQAKGLESLYYRMVVSKAADDADFELLNELVENAQKLPPKALGKLLLYLIALDFEPSKIERVGNALLQKVEKPEGETLFQVKTYLLWRLLNGKSLLKEAEKFLRGGDDYSKILRAAELLKERKAEEAEKILKSVNVEKLNPYWGRALKALEVYINYLKTGKVELQKLEPPAVAYFLYNLDRTFSRKLLLRYVEEKPSPESFQKAFSVVYSKGDLSFTVGLFKRAVELYPDNPEILNTYAYTLLLLKGKSATGEACPLLEKAYELSKGDKAIADSLGWCYFLKGDLKNAEKYLKEALKDSEDESVILYHYAELLKAEGECEKALEYAERALKALKKLPREDEPDLSERIKKMLKELKGCHSKSNR